MKQYASLEGNRSRLPKLHWPIGIRCDKSGRELVRGKKSPFNRITSGKDDEIPHKGVTKPRQCDMCATGMGNFPSTTKEKQTYTPLPSQAYIRGETFKGPTGDRSFRALWLLKQQRG